MINEFFLIPIVFLGLLLAIVIDNLIVLARYSASVLQSNAVGAYLSQVLMLLSRLSVVMFLPISALLVDIGTTTSTFISLYSYTALAMLIVVMVLYKNRKSFYIFFMKRVKSVLNDKSDNHIDLNLHKLEFRDFKDIIFLSCFIVSSINILGLTLPIIASSIFVDYSTSLSHLGGFINVFATLINTFILERRMSISFESNESNDRIIVLLTSSRIISYSLIFIFYTFWAISI